MSCKVTYITDIFKHYLLEKNLGFWGAQLDRKSHLISIYFQYDRHTHLDKFFPPPNDLKLILRYCFQSYVILVRKPPMNHFNIRLGNIKK
jgi:hypothetical protein